MTTLKEIRLAAGLSQKALAEKIGRTVLTISYLERQAGKPSVDTLIALRYVLGEEVDKIDWTVNESKKRKR